MGLEVGIERPDLTADPRLILAMSLIERDELVHQPFGMHPAQRMEQDGELAGPVADDHQIERDALLDQLAEQQALGANTPMALARDPQGIEMRGPGGPDRCNVARRVGTGQFTSPATLLRSLSIVAKRLGTVTLLDAQLVGTSSDFETSPRGIDMNRRVRLLAVGISVITTVWVGLVSAQAEVGTALSALPVRYAESTDPQQQQYNLYDFIWRSFIALNWPNVPLKIEGSRVVSGERGKPDTSRPLSVMSGADTLPQTVWETYKAPFEVFPPQGNEPEAWNSVRPAPPELEERVEGARTLLAYPIELTGYATDANQPYFYPHVTGPLYDQDNGLVRYEVAVNRSFFAYVRHFRYYNAAEQIAAVKNYLAGRRDDTAFQRPPFGNPAEIAGYLHDLPAYARVGLVDVKAAWRVLDPQKHPVDRYLHRNMVVGVEDGKPKTQLMGLVALHILRWTPNGYDPVKGIDGAFVASTFEHIDNVATNVAEDGTVVTPTFNSGQLPTPRQLEYGFEGEIPLEVEGGKPLPKPEPVGIYRAAAQRLPAAVRRINAHYQTTAPVKDSVLRYYHLIGTQNHHQGTIDMATAEGRERNGHQGPITGIYTNANNLVNSALESYTQKNFSCILCHVRARPLGLPADADTASVFPPAAFEDDHFKILTFLLQSAKMPAADGTASRQ